ncbi:hypothetical protein Salat_0876500 [Sesamum alatum]|uniref:Uncharacterized protein n=1 Tax=Sesamum alatum TaxID=300844 RepID=A0AAE1YIZ4_9LAMI|nr:hypothetical protein Salat_0876500 [Sesamum alatum]
MEDSGRAWGDSLRIRVAINVTRPLTRVYVSKPPWEKNTYSFMFDLTLQNMDEGMEVEAHREPPPIHPITGVPNGTESMRRATRKSNPPRKRGCQPGLLELGEGMLREREAASRRRCRRRPPPEPSPTVSSPENPFPQAHAKCHRSPRAHRRSLFSPSPHSPPEPSTKRTPAAAPFPPSQPLSQALAAANPTPSPSPRHRESLPLPKPTLPQTPPTKTHAVAAHPCSPFPTHRAR